LQCEKNIDSIELNLKCEIKVATTLLSVHCFSCKTRKSFLEKSIRKPQLSHLTLVLFTARSCHETPISKGTHLLEKEKSHKKSVARSFSEWIIRQQIAMASSEHRRSQRSL